MMRKMCLPRLRLLKLAALCLVFLVGLTGCGAEAEQPVQKKVLDRLSSMETYSALAEVEKVSNKGSITYKTKQYCKKTGEYRLEFLSPDSVAGNVIVYDGQTINQLNPKVDEKVITSIKKSPARDEMLLSTFVKNFMEQDDAQKIPDPETNEQYTVLSAAVSGSSPYLSTEKLWVDNASLSPVKLVIYDKDGTARISVSYVEFVYNSKLDDGIFKFKATAQQ